MAGAHSWYPAVLHGDDITLDWHYGGYRIDSRGIGSYTNDKMMRQLIP